ncbi:ABC transporter permease [bacterium]|nr:ABC transporter permease [bacterium]
MTRFLLRRLALLAPTMLGVVTLVFFLIHLVPGDPVEVMLGETASTADKEVLRARLGLNDPIGTQYARFLTGVARGDLGDSFFFGEPVTRVIARRLPATIRLSAAAMFLAILIGIPAGLLAAARAGTAWDRGAMVGSMFGVAVPNFWLGPMLIVLFAIKLDWFPVAGDERAASVVLPAITLGTALAAILSRMTRAAVLEELSQDYVLTARAKGLPGRSVLVGHALRNALAPVITIVALQVGALLSGAIITETVFSWPGLGTLLIGAIRSRDYPIVQGCVLFISAAFVLANLAADILYGVIDPRVRVSGRAS